MRLLDLGLFSRVELQVLRDPIEDAPVLHVELEERPHLIAYPPIEWDPDTGFSYGAYFEDQNFRGRAQSLSLLALWGGRRTASFGIDTPWVGPHRLGLGLAAYISRDDKPTEEIREDRRGLSLLVRPGKRRGEGFLINPGWERAQSHALPDADPPPPPEDDDHRWLTLGAYLDSRLYRARATSGSYLGLSVTRHGGPLGGDTDFWRSSLDLLHVVPTGGGTALSGGSRLAWSDGDVPRYLRLNLGGSSTLRGYARGEYGGESRWIGWLEERVPLLGQRQYKIRDGWPRVDLTVDGVVFFDAGSVWEDDALTRGDAKARFGGGAGLRFYLPIVQVLRVEAATNLREVRLDATAGLRL